MKEYEIKITGTANGWTLGTVNGRKFSAKVYDEPSDMGINRGRISKLSVCGVCNYDRGWDVKPQTREAAELVAELVDFLESTPKEFEAKRNARGLYEKCFFVPESFFDVMENALNTTGEQAHNAREARENARKIDGYAVKLYYAEPNGAAVGLKFL